MIDGKRVLALIPARSGSKGIPHKNIVDVDGKPLVGYSIDAALGSKYVDRCLVSTDDEEIANVSRDCGAWVPFLRPSELANDHSKTIDCVVHAVTTLRADGEPFDVVVLLQPTSPLRTMEQIDGAIEEFEKHGERGLVTIVRTEETPIFMRTYDEKTGALHHLLDVSSTVRRQDMPTYWRITGSIYINTADDIVERRPSLNDNPIGFPIDARTALDIDTMSDLERARRELR